MTPEQFIDKWRGTARTEPAWLDNVHRELDAAVAAAYGWPADISEEDALARLLDLNRERAGAGRWSGLSRGSTADHAVPGLLPRLRFPLQKSECLTRPASSGWSALKL